MSEKKPSDLNRREFFTVAGGITLATLVAKHAVAADAPAAKALPELQETDSIAQSMGYKSDTTKVDAKKFATHKPNQQCDNCRFFQGNAGAPGPCQIFAGKSVAAKGWCQVYAAK